MIDGDRLPTLEGERVRLRWLTEADVGALYAIFADPEVTRFWSAPPLPDREAAAALLDEIRRCFAGKTLFQWGVALRDTDEVVGTCTLAALDAAHRRAELGFALARAWQGRGLMTEALHLLLDYAFGTLGLRRIEADVDPDNGPSLRTVERLGFVREGVLRQRWLADGRPRDGVFFGLLAAEWQTGPGRGRPA